MLGTAIKVLTFLFVTLTLIAVNINTGTLQSDKPVTFIGISISDPILFIFIAFMVGNVLFTVCSGLFYKFFVYEFMILELALHDKREQNFRVDALLFSDFINIFSFIDLFYSNILKKYMKVFSIVNVYSKYAVITMYAIFYYTTLFSFVIFLGDYEGTGTMRLILIIANLFTALIGLVIFLPVRRAAD